MRQFTFQECVDHIVKKDGAQGALGPFLWSLPWSLRQKMRNYLMTFRPDVELPLAITQEHKPYYMAPGDME